MADPRFYRREGPFSIAELADHIGLDTVSADLSLSDIAALDEAGADALSFFSNAKLADKLAASRAGRCFGEG